MKGNEEGGGTLRRVRRHLSRCHRHHLLPALRQPTPIRCSLSECRVAASPICLLITRFALGENR